MICPKRGELVSKLYKPGSAGISAARKAHRLACRPQRQSSHDRALSQAFKRQHQLALGLVKRHDDHVLRRAPEGIGQQ